MPSPKHHAEAKAFIETLRPMLNPGPGDLRLARINPEGSDNEYEVSLLGTPVRTYSDQHLRSLATGLGIDPGTELSALPGDHKRKLLEYIFELGCFDGLSLGLTAQDKGVELFRQSGIGWGCAGIDDEDMLVFRIQKPDCPLGGEIRWRLNRSVSPSIFLGPTYHAVNDPAAEVVDFSGDRAYSFMWWAVAIRLDRGRSAAIYPVGSPATI